ncbi:MAG: hypothetical protein Q4D58_00265 [Synergistaceae bacterium]|nr:hypothetical protein [Synergistaceae bacterium]
MALMKFDGVSFDWQALLDNSRKGGRRRKISDDMAGAARRAYDEGVKVLEMRAVMEIYKKEADDDEGITLSLPDGASERIYIGPRVGYLFPAHETAVLLCSVGEPLVTLMRDYAAAGDHLMMYYLDVLGVRALAEVSARMRAHVESAAKEKGWGVGPSMQPGSVEGWGVQGQRDLYRLAHGERIGLALNEASFLIPHISDSAIIGMGPHYSESRVGSMCHECHRRDKCLWRRENVKEA